MQNSFQPSIVEKTYSTPNLLKKRTKNQKMKIFLDTAVFEDIHKFNQTGLIDGVTTNPSLDNNLHAFNPSTVNGTLIDTFCISLNACA